MQKERHVRSARVLAALIAFSFVLLPLSSGYAQVADTSVVIAWAELGSDSLEIEYSNAAVLVPRQLMTALSFVKLRYPGQEEKDMALRKAEDAGLESARKALATARAQRDLKALSVRDPARKVAELLTADAAVAKAEAALSTALDAAGGHEGGDREIAVDASVSTVPVVLVPWAEHASGALLPVVEEPSAVCDENKLDLLMYGRIKPKGTFLAVELALYDAALGRDIWKATDYAFADGLEDLVSSLVRTAATALLGRPYARVEFRVEPAVANVYLDGTAWSEPSILYFEPGLHEVRAQADGFEKADSSFLVEPGFDALIKLKLAEIPSAGVTLSSVPPGAAVHIDGAQVGLAPLDLPGVAYPRVARVSLPGYEDVQLVLRPQLLEDQLLVPLSVSDGLTFDNRFDKRKSGFYRSLGWFVASLPIMVLSGGLFQTYKQTGEAYNDAGGSDSEVRKLLLTGDYASQAVFWTSVAASSGLAVNAIVKLVQYIGFAR
ncbi:MAG: hypothetical protein A2Y38_20460 [Spirochaetes bacterium GWB1_59_5]|nr:MAG: hypothetical protein A2Y38_20460 [Spirochaetes bacterium GWB1_59_5]